MPLPYHDSDQREGIIRTEYKNLRSVSWWKSLGIDAVILYSWGAPKYTLIARAIHKAGLKLVIHMDFGGNLKPSKNASWLKIIKSPFVNIFRSLHLSYADVITTSPVAAESFRSHILYGEKIASKVFNMPAPVSTNFHLLPNIEKEIKVVCVGRWSDDKGDQVKRPLFMINVAKEIIERDSMVQVEIYGKIGDKVKERYEKLSQNIKNRIHLMGYALNHTLPEIYNKAQVAICTSRSESTHIASAEAMCCGCSLVVPPRPTLKILHWYTTQNSGSIAAEDTPESMAMAVITELQMWREGKRCAEHIANCWQPIFHVNQAIKQIFK